MVCVCCLCVKWGMGNCLGVQKGRSADRLSSLPAEQDKKAITLQRARPCPRPHPHPQAGAQPSPACGPPGAAAPRGCPAARGCLPRHGSAAPGCQWMQGAPGPAGECGVGCGVDSVCVCVCMCVCGGVRVSLCVWCGSSVVHTASTGGRLSLPPGPGSGGGPRPAPCQSQPAAQRPRVQGRARQVLAGHSTQPTHPARQREVAHRPGDAPVVRRRMRGARAAPAPQLLHEHLNLLRVRRGWVVAWACLCVRRVGVLYGQWQVGKGWRPMHHSGRAAGAEAAAAAAPATPPPPPSAHLCVHPNPLCGTVP